LGVHFTIRRVGGTASTTINSASSNVYPTNSLTAGTAIIAANSYSRTITCTYLSATPTYGWFII